MIQWDPRALAVLERLRQAGFQAVLVGGCVRDFLRGKEPHDYDGATSARPEEIMAACVGLTCVPTGLRHGTVTVLSQGLPVEVTTFRREGTYSDGRHPDQVSFTTSLEEDLSRRDFTINAMAVRTPCAFSGDCGWPPSWTLPSTRTPPRPSRKRRPGWPWWPGSGSAESFSACCVVPARGGCCWTFHTRCVKLCPSWPPRWDLTRKIPTTPGMCTPIW